MPSERRRAVINSLIKRILSESILKRCDLSNDVIITVTRVSTSEKLGSAKVYISIIPDEKRREVFQYLSKIIYFFQQDLNKKLKIRPVPKIILKEEKETIRAAKVEGILAKIKEKELKKEEK